MCACISVSVCVCVCARVEGEVCEYVSVYGCVGYAGGWFEGMMVNRRQLKTKKIIAISVPNRC